MTTVSDDLSSELIFFAFLEGVILNNLGKKYFFNFISSLHYRKHVGFRRSRSGGGSICLLLIFHRPLSVKSLSMSMGIQPETEALPVKSARSRLWRATSSTGRATSKETRLYNKEMRQNS